MCVYRMCMCMYLLTYIYAYTICSVFLTLSVYVYREYHAQSFSLSADPRFLHSVLQTFISLSLLHAVSQPPSPPPLPPSCALLPIFIHVVRLTPSPDDATVNP